MNQQQFQQMQQMGMSNAGLPQGMQYQMQNNVPMQSFVQPGQNLNQGVPNQALKIPFQGNQQSFQENSMMQNMNNQSNQMDQRSLQGMQQFQQNKVQNVGNNLPSMLNQQNLVQNQLMQPKPQ